MSNVILARPWLMFDLGHDMQVLSWAINRPGFVKARRIARGTAHPRAAKVAARGSDAFCKHAHTRRLGALCRLPSRKPCF